MPTTPTYALRYPAAADPADVPTDMGELATDVEAALSTGLGGKLAIPTYSATPPGSPVDGQLWVLPADATAGVNWMFRYRAASASAYKWEFVGGPPLFSQVFTSEATASTTYVDLATVGPQLVTPRAGDYLLRIGANATGSTVGADPLVIVRQVSPSVDLSAPWIGARIASTNGFVVVGSSWRNDGLAAGVTLKMVYRHGSGVGGTVSFDTRFLQALPFRIS